MGLGVWGLGFGVWGLGFGVVWVFGFSVLGSSGLGLRVEGGKPQVFLVAQWYPVALSYSGFGFA